MSHYMSLLTKTKWSNVSRLFIITIVLVIVIIIIIWSIYRRRMLSEGFITWYQPYLATDDQQIKIRYNKWLMANAHSQGTMNHLAGLPTYTFYYNDHIGQSYIQDMARLFLAKTHIPRINIRYIDDINSSFTTPEIFALVPETNFQANFRQSQLTYMCSVYPQFLYIFGHKRRIESLYEIMSGKIRVENTVVTRDLSKLLLDEMMGLTGNVTTIPEVEYYEEDKLGDVMEMLLTGEADIVMLHDAYPSAKFSKWFKDHANDASSIILIDLPPAFREQHDPLAPLSVQAVDLNDFQLGYLPKTVNSIEYHRYRPTFYLLRMMYAMVCHREFPDSVSYDMIRTLMMYPKVMIGGDNQIKLSQLEFFVNKTNLPTNRGVERYMTDYGYQTTNPDPKCALAVGKGTC